MPAFTGSLNVNEIQSSIYNMIIGQYINTRNINNTYNTLLNMARRNVGLYGDQELHYATDAYRTYEYNPDTTEQCNVLAVHRPPAPKCQAIQLNNARYIPVTIDDYFTKRAFMSESAFSDYNAVIVQWLRDTMEIYLTTMYNAFIGTNETNVGQQVQTIDLSDMISTATSASDNEAANRLRAVFIGEKIANILVSLSDPIQGKNFNDYGFYRSWNPDDLVIVWNSAYFNQIRKVDLVTIFHDEGIVDKLEEKYVLPETYFGTVNTSSGTATASNTTVRALVEKEYTVSGTKYHVFPGELIPNGAAYLANETYTVNPDIICKIMHKESVPVLDGVEGEKVFINGRNWSENRYLHFLVNTPEHLKDMPFITVKNVTA